LNPGPLRAGGAKYVGFWIYFLAGFFSQPV
jgi:hypothetical protein